MAHDLIKVGDIFKATWGYDQTNVDFYVVTRLTPKMVELQECGYKTVGDPTSWASDNVAPDPEKRIGGTFLRRPSVYGAGTIRREPCVMVSINSVSVAAKMFDVNEVTHRSWWA